MEKHNHKIYIANYNNLFALMHILLFGGISASILFLVLAVNNLDSKNPYLGTGIICILISAINIFIGYIGYKTLRRQEKDLKIIQKKYKYNSEIILPSYISILFIVITIMIIIVMLIHLITRYHKNKKHFILFKYKKYYI